MVLLLWVKGGKHYSSFSTTANIYAHIDVDSKMEAANMIASKINLGELPEKKKSPKRKIA